MSFLRSFALFWWNFIVGDDWQVALGLGVGLAVLAEHQDAAALEGHAVRRLVRVVLKPCGTATLRLIDGEGQPMPANHGWAEMAGRILVDDH